MQVGVMLTIRVSRKNGGEKGVENQRSERPKWNYRRVKRLYTTLKQCKRTGWGFSNPALDRSKHRQLDDNSEVRRYPLFEKPGRVDTWRKS